MEASVDRADQRIFKELEAINWPDDPGMSARNKLLRIASGHTRHSHSHLFQGRRWSGYRGFERTFWRNARHCTV